MLGKDSVQNKLHDCATVVHLYSWLLDCYVLDYYVDNHWDKLPKTWQECFQNMDPGALGDILAGKLTTCILPMSFMALRKVVESLSISRQPTHSKTSHQHSKTLCSYEKKYSSAKTIEKISGRGWGSHPRFQNLFLKHVKAKKRHEISLMCKVVHGTSVESGCDAVIDLGSGVGHLVRSLAYQYDLSAIGIEQQQQLTEEAGKLDKEFEYTASKHITEECALSMKRPLHICASVSPETGFSTLTNSFKQYGLVGLHPCGDLGPFLIRQFANCDQVKFICVVGCCYMKLTCNGDQRCYPMSRYLGENPCPLSYESREIACHALDTYIDRLRSGNYHDLQVHSYRAALEVILLRIDKTLKHNGIRSIKHTNTLSFERYCELAFERLGRDVPWEQVVSEETTRNLEQWRRVVIFYTLRLMLAPLVETVLLLDRVLYLLECGFSCDILPVFDPRLSPRNHIIIGKKISS